MYSDDAEVIGEAERTVYHAQWRIWEGLALEQLARKAGLACAPLVAGWEVIQLVTCSGEHLGHIRRDSTHDPARCWIAVTITDACQVGGYPTASDAAKALAGACGKISGGTRR